MLEQVMETIRKVLNMDNDVKLTGTTQVDDIPEWDSFGLIAIFSAIEKEFQVKLTYKDMMRIGSIQDIADILEEKKNGEA